MTRLTKVTGLVVTSVALAAPVAHASSTAPLTAAHTARLGAQTEAQGFKGIDRYLKLRFTQQSAAQTAQAGAQTEAISFKGIDRYLKLRFTQQIAQAGAETEAVSFTGIQTYLEQRFG
jgi:hypothetical protein